MPTTERSSIEEPTLQRSPQTSRMGFASLVYPMSMVWASSLVRTSNTADSSLLPHNKSSLAIDQTVVRHWIRVLIPRLCIANVGGLFGPTSHWLTARIANRWTGAAGAGLLATFVWRRLFEFCPAPPS